MTNTFFTRSTNVFRQYFMPVTFALAVMLSGCTDTSLSETESVQRAKEFQAQGDWRSSIVDLKNALQQNLDNIEARWLLGLAYIEIGDGTSAEKELRRAQKLGVTYEAVSLPLAKALLLQGKQDEVIDTIPITAHLPNNVKAELLTLRGEIYLNRNELEKAAGDFDAALAAKEDSAVARLGQALLAIRQRQWDSTRHWIHRALEKDPEYAEAWSMLGLLEQELENYTEAEQAYTKAIAYRLNNRADIFNRALVYIQLQDYDKAQQDAARLPGSMTGRHYIQGLVHFRQNRFNEAQNAFEESLNKPDASSLSLLYLGTSHYAQNNLQQAEQYLNQFLLAVPGSVEGAILLAQTRMRNQDLRGAKSALEPLAERNPDDSRLMHMLGSLYLALGDADRAVDYLERAVELQPDVAEMRIRLGMSLLNQGKISKGISELDAAMRLNPQILQADLLLYAAHARAGDSEKMLEVANNLLAKQPENPISHHLRGVAFMVKGDDEKARDEFQNALSFDPNFSSAGNNLAKLNINANDTAAAEAQYLQVLERNQTDINAMIGLANLAEQTGRANEAFDWLERAWKTSQNSLPVGLKLAGMYIERNDVFKAMAVTKNLYTNYPDNPAVLHAHGITLIRTGDISSATDILRKLTELQPESSKTWHLWATAQIQSGDYSTAMESLEKSLAIQKNYLPSLVSMGRLQLQKQDFDAALKTAQAIQQHYSTRSAGHELEGEIHLRRGEFDKAIIAFQAAEKLSPTNKSVALLANAHYKAGNITTALATLQDWLNAHPQDTMVRTLFANYLEQADRLDAAIVEYEKISGVGAQNVALSGPASEPKPSISQADINLVQAYLRRKEFDKALAVASDLISRAPESPIPHNLLGTTYMAMGEDNRAQLAFEQALRLQPDSDTAEMNLAQLDTKSGNLDAAKARYQRILSQQAGHVNATLKLVSLLGRSSESLELLKSAWEKHPQSLDIGLALTQEYLADNNFGDALSVANALGNTYSNDPRVVYAQGLTQERTGQPTLALASFNRLVQLQPGNPETWYELALFQGRQKDYDASMDALNKSLQTKDDYLPALLAKTKLLEQLQRFDDGLALTRQIQTAYPNRAVGYVLEGDIHLARNNHQDAIATFKKAYEKAPSGPLAIKLSKVQRMAGNNDAGLDTLRDSLASDSSNDRVRLELALVLHQMHRTTEAIAEYETILERFPNNWFVLNNLASLYLETGNDQALNLAERAYSLAPDEPEAADTLGWILIQSNQAQKGLRVLQKAQAKFPKSPGIRYHLALAYEATGDQQSAINVLSGLLKDNTDFPQKEAARTLLSTLSSQQ